MTALLAFARPATIEAAERQMRPCTRGPDDRTQQIMAQIQGEDHRQLAILLDYRVTKLEDRLDDAIVAASHNGEALAAIDAKVDILLDKPERPPPVWQNPAWLRSVALVIAATAAAIYALGRDLAGQLFSWFAKHLGG